MSAFLDKHRCPITHEVMIDPVLAPDTHNYERSAITHALSVNPISPMTRQPIRLDQLIENRELRQEIQQLRFMSEQPTDDLDQITSENEKPAAIPSMRCSGDRAQLSVTIPDGDNDNLSVVFVIDTSGSMTTEVTTGDLESDGYNMMDIACHGTNVCMAGLREHDKAGVVSFSSSASVVCPLRKMSVGNKGLSKVSLAGLSPNGSTNLWDGLKHALEMLPDDGIVCLLTDGVPNIRPMQGELKMLDNWIDEHPNWHGQIHTFGFGYNLDSVLLADIARMGFGSYSFIPDSALVGSVFVHAMANIRTTHTANYVLTVETDGVIEGIGPHIKTSWGYHIPVGPLTYGQRRDYFLQCSEPMSFSVDGKAVTIEEGIPESDERQRVGLAMCAKLQSRISLDAMMSTVTDPDLLEDIKGQWVEAIEETAFKRWGKHYLPSLGNCHLTQTCNNFMDKGIQKYGGHRFKELRDEGDTIFNTMAAPRASHRARVQQRMTSRGESMRRAPVTMASYNCRSGPCFPGWCNVETKDGEQKSLDTVQKGDYLKTPGGITTVLCVLKTLCPDGTANIVKIGNLIVTPWHPIRPSNLWIFPSMIGKSETIQCEAVYSLLLSTPSCYIEGIECIGLAHGIEDDKVASHPFFGTQQGVRALSQCIGYEQGVVTLSGPEAIERDTETNLVCGLHSI